MSETYEQLRDGTDGELGAAWKSADLGHGGGDGT